MAKRKLTPKQRVLKKYPMACLGYRPATEPRKYAVMRSAISWGPALGADGSTPRKAWANAADNCAITKQR